VRKHESLISVVIPVFNGERFLFRTLESVLSQTYAQIEIIIVDDGSTDRTPEILETAAAHNKSVRHFRIANSGAAAARNIGIRQARGEFIALCDADDLWHPEKIRRQVQVLQASSRNVGLVYCWSIPIDESDFVLEKAIPLRVIEGWVTMELLKGNFIANSSSPLIRLSCIESIGGYDTALRPQGAADWKLYLALSEICKFKLVPEYLVGYRRWTGAMSSDIMGMAKSIDLVKQWARERWPCIPNKIWADSAYGLGLYLSKEALKNKQLASAIRYRAMAYTVRPTALFERANLKFAASTLAMMFGFTMIRHQQGEARIHFHDLPIFGSYDSGTT
jgi:glycosyltransferase involved in cell wall biosynthesis